MTKIVKTHGFEINVGTKSSPIIKRYFERVFLYENNPGYARQEMWEEGKENKKKVFKIKDKTKTFLGKKLKRERNINRFTGQRDYRKKLVLKDAG